MHAETASVNSRNLSTASRKLTLQALDRVEMTENDVIKFCVRSLDKKKMNQIIALSKATADSLNNR